MRGLKGRVVIVTGGASGIGAAICRRFCEEDAVVAVFDIDAEAAEHTAAAIRDTGARAYSYPVDITNQLQVNAAVEEVEKVYDSIDVLVNNAGWDRARTFLHTDRDLWEKIVAINIYGPLHMHHAVLKGMNARGRGRIVNIASDAGRVGSSGEAVYSLCKGGIISFTKTVARELAKKQINMNVVCPGPTETRLLDSLADTSEETDKLKVALTRSIPFGRLGKADDLAGIVCFLASDDASFITGQVISVSGGLTMVG